LTIQNGWYYTHNKTSDLHFYTLPYVSTSFEASATKENLSKPLNNFLNMMSDGQEWEIPIGTPDKWDRIDTLQEATYEVERVNHKYTIYYKAQVKNSSILVVAIVYETEKLNEPNYLNQATHFLLSGYLATFSEY
jgi:hypothetical protein